jgi:hypothetical protein
MQIDRSDEQPSNAWLARIDSSESGSNVKSERFRHLEKQPSEIVSTEDGMQIDRRDGNSAKAESPKVESPDLISKVTFERPERWKQPLEMVSIDEGRKIDRNDEQS